MILPEGEAGREKKFGGASNRRVTRRRFQMVEAIPKVSRISVSCGDVLRV